MAIIKRTGISTPIKIIPTINLNLESGFYFLSIWPMENYNLDNLEQQKDKIHTIVIDQGVEYLFNQLYGDDFGVAKLIKKYPEKNFIIITCNYKYDYNYINWDENPNVKILDYNGYWICKAFSGIYEKCLNSDDINIKNNLDIKNNNICLDTPLEHLFISLNNISHVYRARLMDELAKNNLIEKGAISWRDVSRMYDNQRTDELDSVRHGYVYKYWKPKRMYLDQPLIDYSNNVEQYHIPIQIKSSFAQIVAESTVNQGFISEKTTTSIFYNKMFMVLGCQNFHANLVEMGFKMYENVFDYSFDSDPDYEIRVEKIVKNIKRYENYSMTDLQKIINSNKSIIKYNRELAIEYLHERIPKEMYDLNETLLSNKLPRLWAGFIPYSDINYVKSSFYGD